MSAIRAISGYGDEISQECHDWSIFREELRPEGEGFGFYPAMSYFYFYFYFYKKPNL